MSVLTSITDAMVPVRKEGYPFIAIFFVVALVLGSLWSGFFWIGLGLTAWCAYFFRDPERVVPQDERLAISPADGVVTAVGLAQPPSELGLDGGARLRISVFMNVFSVHVNRAPLAGRVTRAIHRPGQFLNAALDKASDDNERSSIVIESAHGEVVSVQIAGLVARRILSWAKEGQSLGQGERYGLIRFGSRVDVFLPEGWNPRVTEGQTALAGETVLAEFGGAEAPPAARLI
ncbi:MAG: phosphatidylserine decarboxylase [Rhizobiaceae bacterium]|jgi:phosphatidylserine decarboxylase|nr:phosphatidylserine decarboxylase [Rhizobiaceae bacterium]